MCSRAVSSTAAETLPVGSGPPRQRSTRPSGERADAALIMTHTLISSIGPVESTGMALRQTSKDGVIRFEFGAK